MSKRRGDRRDANYEVGYGRPPVSTRFVKGQSGNPNGKPKRKKANSPAKSQTELLHQVAQQPIRIMLNGTEKTVPMMEAVIIKTFQAALAGKQDAVRTIFNAYPAVEEMLRRSPPIPDDETLAKMDVHQIAETYRRLMGAGDRRF